MTTHSTYRIAVIGPSDLVSGFKALGADVFNANSGTEALTQLKQLKQDTVCEEQSPHRYGAIFVIDHLINDIPDEEYKQVTQGPLPSIIAIPGLQADKGAGSRKLRHLTERAIGSDILS